jgi:hypothetical protein
MRQRVAFLPVLLLSGLLLLLGAGVYREHTLTSTLVAHSDELAKRLLPYNQHLEQQADANAQHIAYNVRRNRNQARDLVVLQQTQLITKRADSMADSLGAVSLFLALTDTQPPLLAALGLADNGQGPAAPAQLQQLAQHLDRYAAFIRHYVPDALPLALPPSHPGEPADFGTYYFGNIPEAGVQATLARLQTQVRRYEADAISQQAQKVGGQCWGFDRIGVAAVPVSNTVAPGGLYEARMLMASASSGYYYKQMSVNGQKISRFEYEHGIVELAIPCIAEPCADTLHAKWTGRITTSGYPADSTWQLEVPYSIIPKPRP